uniref:Uncharacterized protein n=1 Tax=Arundo donax TaxID=35708 RepID=A0A0A9C387_ARUDO
MDVYYVMFIFLVQRAMSVEFLLSYFDFFIG